MKIQITITVPTLAPGVVASFKIKCEKVDFIEVLEKVENLKSVADVVALEKIGLIEII